MAGIAESSVSGSRMQHRYIALSTQLSSLNGGRGIGLGRFEIRDSSGVAQVVDIGADSRTIGDVIGEINSRGLNVRARINDNGDGILIEHEDPDAAGSQKIRIRDLSGAVGEGLNIVGEATDAENSNFIDGSFEHVVELEADDTLQDIVTKVNRFDVGVRASIINDGSSSAPFRLSFTSAESGRAGRFTLDAEGIDLDLSRLAEGRDARAFFGSDDPARAVLLSSTTNTLAGVIQGVSIDLRAVDDQPVTVNVSQDTDAIRTAVNDFVTAYNGVIEKIDSYSTYNAETRTRGILLGETLSQQLRSTLYQTVQGQPQGVSGEFQYLAEVGIRLNSDGELEIDQDRLDAALERNPQAVEELFAARVQDPRERVEVIPGITVNNTGRDTFSALGIAELLGEVANNYLDPIDGFLTQRKKTLENQIDQQKKRITDIDSRLDRRRVILEKQFLAMEQALGQLQSQQSALAGLASLTG
jgi:flagellar capping protein FliD